jgi:biotin carboxyl carrier protein
MIYDVTIDGTEHRLELSLVDGKWRCQLDGHDFELDAALVQRDVLSVIHEGKAYEVRRERVESDLKIWVGNQVYAADVRDPRSLRGRQRRADHSKGVQHLVAPMPGKVVKFLVDENAAVEAGQGIVVVEAMKMQNEIKSPKKGIVVKLAVAEGAAVNAGDILAIVE